MSENLLKRELKDYLVYYVCGNSVYGYYDIDGNLIPASTDIYKDQNIKYTSKHKSKKDAMYALFVKRVKSGTPITNFKSSKYYDYYLERASEEHPEILI